MHAPSRLVWHGRQTGPENADPSHHRLHKGARLGAARAFACRPLLCLLTLLPLPALGDAFQTPAISADDLAARQMTSAAPLVVDVRPFGEYKSGHVAGAVNLPYTKIEQHADELAEADNGVVLYCTLGTRTQLAEQTLLARGVPNLYHLDGGLGAWRQGGHEIHTGWGP